LNVVNDGAVRGVKFGSDFLASSKGEEQYQIVLQVVEHENLDNFIFVNRRSGQNDANICNK